MAVDFDVRQRTSRLQVESEGPWHVEFRDVTSAARMGVGGIRAWHGDDVFIVEGADTLTITGNQGARYMRV